MINMMLGGCDHFQVSVSRFLELGQKAHDTFPYGFILAVNLDNLFPLFWIFAGFLAAFIIRTIRFFGNLFPRPRLVQIRLGSSACKKPFRGLERMPYGWNFLRKEPVKWQK